MDVGLSFHPASEIFDLLTGDLFEELVDSIKKNGLILPIWRHPDGSILDGRNRYLACRAAGVEPHFQTWDGQGSAVQLVMALNKDRRHLTDGARQLAAARCAIALEAEALERQIAVGTANLTGKSGSIEPDFEFGKSAEKAADKFGIGRETVKRAITVEKHGIDALKEKVKQGEISVSAAADVARLTKEEQEEIVAQDETDILKTVKAIRSGRYNGSTVTCLTGEEEWYTPANIIEMARRTLGQIDLDPATSLEAQQTVRAAKFYTEEDDGLKQAWSGKVWMNPPYGRRICADFMRKLVTHYEDKSVAEAIALVHNMTDASWFQHAALACTRLCLTNRRIKFIKPGGEVGANTTNGSAVFYFGTNAHTFDRVFSELGVILRQAGVDTF